MLDKNQLCERCTVGKESYRKDPHSYACQYILCKKNGKCRFFKPIKEKEMKRQSFMQRIKLSFFIRKKKRNYSQIYRDL